MKNYQHRNCYYYGRNVRQDGLHHQQELRGEVLFVSFHSTTTSNKPRIKLSCVSNGDDGAAGESTATPKTITYGRYICNSTATTGRCGSDLCVLATATATRRGCSRYTGSSILLVFDSAFVAVVGEKRKPVTRQRTKMTVRDRGRRNNL